MLLNLDFGFLQQPCIPQISSINMTKFIELMCYWLKAYLAATWLPNVCFAKSTSSSCSSQHSSIKNESIYGTDLLLINGSLDSYLTAERMLFKVYLGLLQLPCTPKVSSIKMSAFIELICYWLTAHLTATWLLNVYFSKSTWGYCSSHAVPKSVLYKWPNL